MDVNMNDFYLFNPKIHISGARSHFHQHKLLLMSASVSKLYNEISDC
jgi:hypothetical protein